MELIEENGGWTWVGEGGWRPYKNFDTREEAIEFHNFACCDTGEPINPEEPA